MASFTNSCNVIFHVLLLIQLCSSRGLYDKPKNNHNEENHIELFGKNEHDDLDPAVNVFFHVKDLYSGKKMSIYFAGSDPLTTPRVLAREQADLIPFSSSKLPYILDFISLAEGSPQAIAMEQTLKQCELEPVANEYRFCASSLESMLDLTRGVLGTDNMKSLTTKIHNLTNPGFTLLQGYIRSGKRWAHPTHFTSY